MELFFDIESTSLNPRTGRVHGVAWFVRGSEPNYDRFDKLSPGFLKLFADPNVIKIGHNTRFDLKFLINAGIRFEGQFYDTMLMAMLVNENQPLGLKPLSAKYLGSGLEGKSAIDLAVAEVKGKSVADLCRLDIESGYERFFDLIAKYAKEDVSNTALLYEVLWAKLRSISSSLRGKNPIDYLKTEVVPVERVILKTELTGLRVDVEKLHKTKIEIEDKRTDVAASLLSTFQTGISQVETQLLETERAKRKTEKGKAGVLPSSDKHGTKFNLDSNRHLGMLLYGVMGAEDNSRKMSMSEVELAQVRRQSGPEILKFLDLLSEYRKLTKLAGTFIGDETVGVLSKLEGECIFPSYHHRTTSGRFSSSDPNMQQLPRNSPVKSFFVPHKPSSNIFLYSDFSQVELRIAAHLSGDPNLVDAYVNDRDVHKQTAASAFGVSIDEVTKEQRQAAKSLNFLLIYDGGAYRLMTELRDKNGLNFTYDDCEQFRRNFFNFYSAYKEHLKRTQRFIEEHKGIVADNGRVRRLPEVEYGRYLDHREKLFLGPSHLREKLEGRTSEEIYKAARQKYNHAVKTGFNFIVQSLGASIMKAAIVALNEKGFYPAVTVHDSVVLEVPKNSPDLYREIQETIEGCYKLRVPLKADFKLLNSLEESDKAKL
jgi:DNA polymerase-1